MPPQANYDSSAPGTGLRIDETHPRLSSHLKETREKRLHTDLMPEDTCHPFNQARPELQNLVFLVVDDNPDGRFLVSKTLLRKFPRARVIECQTAETAFETLAQQTPSLIVTHRTFEFNGIDLLRELRQRAPSTPILMTSGIDQRASALSAGADAFYTYDQWPMIGNHVAQLLIEHAGRKSPRT